ncbi:hypothetical protein OY671_002168 [Metschnikowia pulcherrima]|nr:hypothetical protein OY671_002168 [Metschnikowia pulcherrima]
MTDLHDDYDIVSDEEFVLAPDNDAMDITKYHKLVSQNFYLGLPATTEALEAYFRMDTDVNKHVSDMAAGFLTSFTRYVMPSTGAAAQSAALAAALPTLLQRLLARLRQSVGFKAIVAASDFDMFVKYFPSWKLSYDSFYHANALIAEGIENHYKGVFDQFSAWQDHDLGTVIDNVILKARTLSSKIFEYYMEQRDVLHAVIRCWKGGHQKSILLIVELVKRLEDKVPRTLSKQSLGFNQLLYHLYTDFQETGECIIAHWKEKRQWADLCSPETVTQFAREVWPMLPATAKPRIDPEIKGNASFKIQFDAMVKEIGQVDDFYDVTMSSERADMHAISAADVKKRNIDRRLAHERGVADRYFTLMRNLLAQRPDLCPNCLGSHTLSECTVLVKDAWKNPAAFTHSEFEDETGEKRSRRQRGYLKCVIRDNATSSVKSSLNIPKISMPSSVHEMRLPFAPSGESPHYANHSAEVNANCSFTKLVHTRHTQQQRLETSRFCDLHPSSAANSKDQAHRKPFDPSRELPHVTTLSDNSQELPTVNPITSNSIPTIAPTNSESQHHPEHPQQRQSLDVDSRTLTTDIGSSPSVSASHYLVRSTKPSDGLIAPASVITHDLHDFIDKSHGKIPADEPVISPSLAPDSPISSVPRLESVFELSHEFRGDFTSNNYATSPEVVNFRGDIHTTTIHQAVKEVSHEEPSMNTEFLPLWTGISIRMVPPQTEESQNAHQSCSVASLIDTPTVLDGTTTNSVIATDRSVIRIQRSKQTERIIDCGHKDAGLTTARLENDVGDEHEPCRSTHIVGETRNCISIHENMSGHLYSSDQLYCSSHFKVSFNPVPKFGDERLWQIHHYLHWKFRARVASSVHCASCSRVLGNMTCRSVRNYPNQGLEVIRGASSSGVPVQHASGEHASGERDPDKKTETIRDDPIIVLLTEDVSNSGVRKSDWCSKVISSCKSVRNWFRLQGRTFILDAPAL